MNEELQQAIQSTLEQSDIVWPRYGSETIEELAAKIASVSSQKIQELEEEIESIQMHCFC